MTAWFYWLLNMSILGTIAGGAILMLRLVPGLPRRVVCWLWLIPLLRLWLPISLPSPYSLLNLANGVFLHTQPAGQPPIDSVVYSNFVQTVSSYSPFTLRNESLTLVFKIGAWIWASVAAVLAVGLFILYRRANREIRDARNEGDGIYRSPRIRVPAVYGLIRPRIVLPMGTTAADAEWIVRHEAAHVSRRDNIWRLLAMVTACLHWFNPFVWLFLKTFFTDQEQACDEAAVHSLTVAERKAYAAVLLVGQGRQPTVAAPFGGSRLRARIERILTYRRISLVSGILFIVMMAAIALALLTGAQP